jgi:hypothetical protein
MRRFLFASVALCLAHSAVHAQTLSLDKLLTLAHFNANLTAAQSSQVYLPEWTFSPSLPSSLSEEQLTWGWWPTPDQQVLPTALLSLRPVHGTLDVLLKFKQVGPFHQLQREMQRRHQEPRAVTCISCQGERYTLPDYTLSFYQGKPEPFPFIVVLHLSEPAQSRPASPAAASSYPVPVRGH